MKTLNFSWLINGEIAGHSAPLTEDDLEFLESKGIRALVRMAEKHEVGVNLHQIKSHRFMDLYEPVNDFTAPTQNQIDTIITYIKASIYNGMPVGVSCWAGIGRTGTILACYLVSKSYEPEQSMEEVKRKRGEGIETEEQKKAVRTYAERSRK